MFASLLRTHDALLKLVQDRIPAERMPLLVGVGDTVTSNSSADGATRLRGGSDRGFSNLASSVGGPGAAEKIAVVLVDSSHGEVDRPSLSDPALTGISDPDDPLRIDVLMTAGPEQYINWFCQLAAQTRPKSCHDLKRSDP